jgi:hypothetical protein
MAAHQTQTTDDLKQMSPIAARKLRDATPGDEVWIDGRKTPLTIDTRTEKNDRVVFNASGNGYDYIIQVADRFAGSLGECARFPSRGTTGEDFTDDVQGVRHTDD